MWRWKKGIATTVSFLGEAIEVEDGVAAKLHLRLKASNLLLSKILTGKASPYTVVLRGNVNLLAFPRRPLQSLRVLGFLKIPPELLLGPLPSKGRKYAMWALGSFLGLGGLSLLIYTLVQLSDG